MDKNIIPFALKRNWNEFRDSVVHHAKVAEILVDHMNFLRRLYARYSNEVTGRTFFKAQDGLRIVEEMMQY